MKAFLAIIPLLFCSCTTTTATYEAGRDFPLDVTQLDIEIDYSSDFCEGSARTTTFLGFIRLGRSEFAYAGGNAFAIPFLSSGEGTENAAVYDALAKTGGDVLGFPLFRKEVTNYFLWVVDDVWVKGFSGVVSRPGARKAELVESLEERMQRAAAAGNYKEAARIQDRIGDRK